MESLSWGGGLMFKLRCVKWKSAEEGVVPSRGTSCAKKEEHGSGESRKLKGAYCDRRLNVKGRVTGYETGESPVPQGARRPY